MDWTASRHNTHPQPARRARNRCHHRQHHWEQAALASVRQDIIERTDGIPLFIEEMTKAVLEAETEGEVGQIAAPVPSPALAVPASLHASLMARLDRLGAREGGGTDWSSDGAGVLPCAPCCGGS